MSKIAEDVGVNRQTLYRSLSRDGHAEFGTFIKVMKSVGVQMRAEVAEPAAAEPA